MTVGTLQYEDPRVMDLVRLVKRTRVSSYMWHTGLIGLMAMLPSILLVFNPMAGAYGTVAALGMLLFIALNDNECRKLALSAAILPLTLMVMAVIPFSTNTFYQSIVEYGVLLLLASTYSFMFREKLAKKYQLNWKKLPQVLPLVIVIGEVIGGAGYGLLRSHFEYKGIPLAFVAAAVIPFGIAEELLFRGLIQRQAMKSTSKKFAAVLTVAVYATACIGTGDYLPVAFSVLSAAVLSGLYNVKQNLVLTSIANIAMKLTYVGLIAAFILR